MTPTWTIQAPLRWMELHLFCLRADADPATYTSSVVGAWMMGFRNRLICPACQKKWDESLTIASWPKTGLFAWSVKAHNDISGSIGNMMLSLEEARTHWEGVAREIAARISVRPVIGTIAAQAPVAATSACGTCGKK